MSKKNKILKDGVSVQEIENFARKYMNEVFSVLALIVATISSIFDFFTGAGWSLVFAGIFAIVAIIFPDQIERGLKKVYKILSKDEKSTQIILGIVRLVIAIFVPFILFGFIGLLSGISYHIHISKASHSDHSDHEHKGPSDDQEHL